MRDNVHFNKPLLTLRDIEELRQKRAARLLADWPKDNVDIDGAKDPVIDSAKDPI